MRAEHERHVAAAVPHSSGTRSPARPDRGEEPGHLSREVIC